MKRFNKDIGSRDWNHNQGFLIRLDGLFNEANSHSINGYCILWFRTLQVIYRAINYKIKKDDTTIQITMPKTNEEKEIKVKAWFEHHFKIARNKIKTLELKPDPETNQLRSLVYDKFENDLAEIETHLTDLYAKYYIRIESKTHDILAPEETWGDD